MLVLTGARVYTPLEVVEPATLIIDRGRIASLRAGRSPRGEDLKGHIVAPGFVDLHVHGYAGYDATSGEPDLLLSLARVLARHGVTAFIPATVTGPHEVLLRAAEATAEAIKAQGESPDGARILGLELEGPYINPERKGAQNAEFIRAPDWDEFLEYWDAAREKIRTITLAPELPGALEFIERASRLGMVVSLGHTNASYEEAKAAIAAGATRATHLFNAMPPLHHRAPGVVAACLESPQVVVELVWDLVHVAPAMRRLAWRLAGSLRTAH
ncbi:amidohydrolase family protein, partial [Candidatus Bipolaricaulota bacterium]|nr:amidohydrolase family protein [Candidatus Bipolaricaulota bacterium]